MNFAEYSEHTVSTSRYLNTAPHSMVNRLVSLNSYSLNGILSHCATSHQWSLQLWQKEKFTPRLKKKKKRPVLIKSICVNKWCFVSTTIWKFYTSDVYLYCCHESWKMHYVQIQIATLSRPEKKKMKRASCILSLASVTQSQPLTIVLIAAIFSH